MQQAKWRDIVIVAVALAICVANLAWRLSVCSGLIPCSHQCYWCGKPL